MPDRLTFKDLELAIEHARLEGWLHDDVAGAVPNWSIEVRGAAHVFVGEDGMTQSLAPRFYDEQLPLRVCDWRDLADTACRYDLDAGDDENAGPALYLCAHLPLPKSELTLGARSGERFALRWHGLADANWDDDYGDAFAFAIETSIAFAQQAVRFWQRGEDEDFEAAARAIMARAGLSGAHLRYSHHVRFRDDPDHEYYRLIRAIFSPMP